MWIVRLVGFALAIAWILFIVRVDVRRHWQWNHTAAEAVQLLCAEDEDHDARISSRRRDYTHCEKQRKQMRTAAYQPNFRRILEEGVLPIFVLWLIFRFARWVMLKPEQPYISN